ncbi:hypothetical protein JMN32_19770 [Fulvivirga sp. 29W222]|uniref:Uncharacterized protein n=1 Tax=Fulvivirga marina TaxID=2494733 RepID=A0A937FYX2_9BACT|nr:hypothetical protein [Fulvivirga marina]MBL6448559.1 hypothetical protein [Fulvivirga marina]
MNHSSWHDRLAQFIDYLGLKPSSFEGIVGLSNGSISKPLKSKSSIGSDKFEKIFSEYPDLSPTWLLKGQGEMLLSNGPGDSQNQVAEEFVVYLKNNKDTASIIMELRGMVHDARQAHLVGLVEMVINELSKENIELKNKVIKLYEDRDRLLEKVERYL